MKMQPLKMVGDTAQLTDEEIIYIENKITETVRPQLQGRKLFPVESIPNPGLLTVRGYRRTDMSQARISLYGQGQNKDRTVKTAFDITVPVLHKEFTINWRDLAASRQNGQPLDMQEAENAARQVAEEEDKLLLTGEYTGWNALGVEGLNTATGRNTTAGGAWGANALSNLSDAIGKLEEDGHTNSDMYACVMRHSFAAKLRALVSNTAVKYIDVIRDLFPAGIYTSDSLYTSAGGVDSAVVMELSKDNFEMVIEQDMTVFAKQDEDMNLQCKVFEVVAPRIKRPTAICEVTGLS